MHGEGLGLIAGGVLEHSFTGTSWKNLHKLSICLESFLHELSIMKEVIMVYSWLS